MGPAGGALIWDDEIVCRLIRGIGSIPDASASSIDLH
jgi:hypothetical protein